MPTILDKIVATKRQEIAAAKARAPSVLRGGRRGTPPRDFFARCPHRPPIRLIAEVKKASPSKGVIRADFDPVAIARIYEAHGATLPQRADRRAVLSRAASTTCARSARRSNCPCCARISSSTATRCYEARAAGADAVLLIAECLDDCNLRSCTTRSWPGHDAAGRTLRAGELARVFDAGATLIGINNRDLRTFHTDLDHTLRLRERVPAECVVVGESGIRTRADVERLEAAGVDAMLVGETLMASPDIGAAVDELLGGS